MGTKTVSTTKKFSGETRSTGGSPWKPYTLDFTDRATVTSIGHDWPRSKGSGDVGGPFLLDKLEWFVHPVVINRNLVRGATIPARIGTWTFNGPTLASDSTMKGLGTTAIARSLPTNPSASLAQFLGEAREGFPKTFGSGLLKEKTRIAKGAGSEYLNVEFGWKPLVSDVQNFAHAVKHTHKIIRSYHEGSGKKIRRRYAFPPVSDVRTSGPSGGFLTPTIGSYGCDGNATEYNDDRSWFSGAFRYFVPVGSSTLDKMKRFEADANHLLGVRLTPELMWELAPWSWAVDWFTNVGDILHNISALGHDGLLMQYGYMMSSSVSTQVTSFTATEGSGEVIKRMTFKKRIPASPYGFNTVFDGLSNRQKAICAAIGITRVR